MEQYFNETLEQVKALGFRVFKCTDTNYHYAFYSDGVNIGYLQYDMYVGWHISTVNAKGSYCSGMRVYDGEKELFKAEELTKELLSKAFVTYPDWMSSRDRKHVVKYRDLDDFLNRYWNLKNLKEV